MFKSRIERRTDNVRRVFMWRAAWHVRLGWSVNDIICLKCHVITYILLVNLNQIRNLIGALIRTLLLAKIGMSSTAGNGRTFFET